MSTITQALASGTPQLRPLNILRDLPRVADLVETCFSGTMDAEGQRFIQQMRRAGQDNSFLRWAVHAVDSASMPLSGYVWEEDGQLVGNVSLIPYHYHSQKIFMIANVAVHPDHRRQGIARLLTEKAIEHCWKRNAQSTWLQVRHDNPGAIQLYSDLGFIEQARRTQWQAAPDKNLVLDNPGIEIHSRSNAFWNLQRQWLERLYPEGLSWYQPMPWISLRPGIVAGISRFFMESDSRTWKAVSSAGLIAAVSWISNFGKSQPLWAAFPEDFDNASLTALLVHVRRTLAGRENLSLDLPGAQAEEAVRSAGFQARRTLIWMKVDKTKSEILRR